jgi:predicted transposase YbfD/YdcC
VVEATREIIGGAPSVERRYYLSSLPANVEDLARAVRSHWGVENQLHWCLDVTFKEDGSRARTRFAATNLATLRRISLNLLRADRASAKSLPRKRLRCALDPSYLAALLKL